MGILSLPKTIGMLLIWCVPVAIMYFSTQFLPIVFLFGLSGPVFICALLYNKTFKKFEPSEEVTKDEDWTVNPDSQEQDTSQVSQESGEKTD